MPPAPAGKMPALRDLGGGGEEGGGGVFGGVVEVDFFDETDGELSGAICSYL